MLLIYHLTVSLTCRLNELEALSQLPGVGFRDRKVRGRAAGISTALKRILEAQ